MDQVLRLGFIARFYSSVKYAIDKNRKWASSMKNLMLDNMKLQLKEYISQFRNGENFHNIFLYAIFNSSEADFIVK